MPVESACRCGSDVSRRATHRARRAPIRARGTAAARAPACRPGVHCHASASPSRSAATARRDSTTPFGSPVVPDVYMISAVESAAGSPPVQSDSPPTGTCGNVTSAHCGSPIVAAAPESRSMCSRSIGPASAGIGTTGTPASRPATTPITVSSVLAARNATAGMPELAAPPHLARAVQTAPTTPHRRRQMTAASWSPNCPFNDGSSVHDSSILTTTLP